MDCRRNLRPRCTRRVANTSHVAVRSSSQHARKWPAPHCSCFATCAHLIHPMRPEHAANVFNVPNAPIQCIQCAQFMHPMYQTHPMHPMLPMHPPRPMHPMHAAQATCWRQCRAKVHATSNVSCNLCKGEAYMHTDACEDKVGIASWACVQQGLTLFACACVAKRR